MVVSTSMPTPIIVRECHVTFNDSRGFTHTLKVHTSSLMRAAAHALKEIEEGNLLEGCDLLGEARVEIVTRTVHTIHISKVRDWLKSGTTPREIASKRDLQTKANPKP